MTRVILRQPSGDHSVKYAFENDAGNKFEAIYFHFRKEGSNMAPTPTICLSSQAGCAMGCTFCATGFGGFFADLSPEEMVAQVDLVSADAEAHELPPPRFAVLMGMGEPLVNVPGVIGFHRLISGRLRALALSTIGIIPGIREIASTPGVLYKLFLSVHSPYDEQRGEIMPINKKYPIRDVIEECRRYVDKTRIKVEASYLLLADYNDSEQHARDYGKLLDPDYFTSQILLFNAIPEARFKRPTLEVAERFRRIVVEETGIDASIQISAGQETGGGCGQMIEEVRASRQRRLKLAKSPT